MTIHSDIPPRLDALGFTAWHRRVVIALGITWILDGLEASLIANLAPSLRLALGLSATEIGSASSIYLLGQVLGALLFGHLTDRLGRKRLFLVTLSLYLVATALCAVAPNFTVFLLLRFLAGAGIGGEYSAINSAIDELVPARVRGQVDLTINGSYWIGVALGAGLTVALFPFGWRAPFAFGAVLGIGILLVRRHVPESPRWLLMHGRVAEANAVMAEIEASIGVTPEAHPPVPVHTQARLFHTLFVRYRRRAILGLALMIAQAFLYNSIFFSYGLILEKFHGVQAQHVGWFIVPFAIGNFLGPFLLGPLFDRLGRRVMIPFTYALSGIFLVLTGVLLGSLNAVTQTIAWCVVFFFASAAASSAYLTVSELFPIEHRGMAIAIFYAIATLAGAIAPTAFGAIVEAGSLTSLFYGYAFAGALMCFAALVARWLGVDAEGRSLESLTEL